MQNFLDALKLVAFPIHKEGYKFILIFAFVAIGFALVNNYLGLREEKMKMIYNNTIVI